MSDVQVNQTNTPHPTPPPGSEAPPPGPNMWPIIIAILVLVALLVWFVLSRGERTELPDTTDIEVPTPRVPDVEPEVRTPTEVDIEVPERVDVNVNTEGGTEP